MEGDWRADMGLLSPHASASRATVDDVFDIGRFGESRTGAGGLATMGLTDVGRRYSGDDGLAGIIGGEVIATGWVGAGVGVGDDTCAGLGASGGVCTAAFSAGGDGSAGDLTTGIDLASGSTFASVLEEPLLGFLALSLVGYKHASSK